MILAFFVSLFCMNMCMISIENNWIELLLNGVISICISSFVLLVASLVNKKVGVFLIKELFKKRQIYEYDEKDISRIYDAIKRELNDSQAKFKISCKKNNDFKL